MDGRCLKFTLDMDDKVFPNCPLTGNQVYHHLPLEHDVISYFPIINVMHSRKDTF